MNLDLDILAENVRTFCRTKEFVKARYACEECLALTKNDADRASVFHCLAYIENAAGDLPTNISLLRRARKLDPKSRAVLDALMISMIKSGNFVEARDICISLIDLDKQFPYQSFTSSAYFYLAFCYLHLSEFKDAELALEKCDYTEPMWIDGGLMSKLELLNLIKTKRASLN